MSKVKPKDVCSGECEDEEGVIRTVGEIWSDPGVCNLKACRRGSYIEHTVCPQLEIPEGCWLLQGDVTQEFPLCCPRAECPDESSSSSSSSSEDDDPDKYEDLEEDEDDGGDEFAFANLESFGQDLTNNKHSMGNRNDVQHSERTFSEIVEDAEKYIKSLNIDRDIRTSEESNAKGELNENTAESSGNNISNGTTTDVTHSQNNEQGVVMYSDNTEVKYTGNNGNQNVPSSLNNDQNIEKEHVNEQPKGENINEVNYNDLESGYEELNDAIDVIVEENKKLSEEGVWGAPLPPGALDGMEQVNAPFKYTEDFIKSLGTDEEFEKSAATITNEYDRMTRDEFGTEFAQQEGLHGVNYNEPGPSNFYEGRANNDDFWNSMETSREAQAMREIENQRLDFREFRHENVQNEEEDWDNHNSIGYSQSHVDREESIDNPRHEIEGLEEGGDIETPDGNIGFESKHQEDFEEYLKALENSEENHAHSNLSEGMMHSQDGTEGVTHAYDTDGLNATSLDSELLAAHSDNLSHHDPEELNNEDIDDQELQEHEPE